MKKAIFFFSMFLIVSVVAFSQQKNPSQPLTKTDYLKKSKNQKTVAFILLGGATALVITGIVDASNNWGSSDLVWGAPGHSIIIGGSGGLLALASIPFFAASAKKQEKVHEFIF